MNMILYPARRRAALLLEIVVALTIMIAAMALVGSQLLGGLRFVGHAEQQARAGELADRLLALLELDPQTTQTLIQEQAADGDFGEQYPAYRWRASVEPLTDVVGLNQLSIEILHQPDPLLQDDPDSYAVVHRLHMLKADPGRIDLAADFGLEQEQIDQLSGVIPIPGFDPTQLNPQELVSLDPLELLAMLPQLMGLFQQFFGSRFGGAGGGPGGMPDFGSMSPDQLRDFLLQQMEQRGQLGADGGDGGSGDAEGPGAERTPFPGGQMPPGLEELLRLRDEFNAGQGGATPGAGGPRLLTPRAGGPGRGRGAGGDAQNAGRGQRPTIGDLDRMRDERFGGRRGQTDRTGESSRGGERRAGGEGRRAGGGGRQGRNP